MRRHAGLVLAAASLALLAACARSAPPLVRASSETTGGGTAQSPAAPSAGRSPVTTTAAAPALASTNPATTTVPSAAVPLAPVAIPPRVVFHGPGSRKRVALTFDLCATPRHRATLDRGVLRALRTARADATFMMGGLWAEAHPREAALLGENPDFEIGNHSETHAHVTRLSKAAARREVRQAQRAIQHATGRTPRVFRFPYEERSPATVRLVAACGLIPVAEDVISGDPDPNRSADRLAEYVVSSAKPGSIVVMHANGNTEHTADALPRIIAGLRARGFELVTVSELLAP